MPLKLAILIALLGTSFLSYALDLECLVGGEVCQSQCESEDDSCVEPVTLPDSQAPAAVVALLFQPLPHQVKVEAHRPPPSRLGPARSRPGPRHRSRAPPHLA